MKCNIAIPSYKRHKTFREKTASLLEKFEVDPSEVTVFVANKEEESLYRKELSKTPYNQIDSIVVGVPGMGAIRNFIRDYYDEGDYIVNLDDDLSAIKRKSAENEKKLEDITNFYKEIVDPMYNLMKEHDNKLCGVYAASNPFFMNYKPKVGLYYCIGSLWGNINDKHPDRYVKLDDKEDFERTLQHYVLDGSVCRLDNITVESKYYTEQGGMQVERTTDRIHKSAEELVKRYPNLCSMYIRESTGHAELKLKDRSGGVYDKSSSNLDSFFS